MADPQQSIQQKIAALWLRNRDAVREKLTLLQHTADQLQSTPTLDETRRKEAISAAHKLAGSLGMFGYMQATEIARRIEVQLTNEALPERLNTDVTALHDVLKQALAD